MKIFLATVALLILLPFVTSSQGFSLWKFTGNLRPVIENARVDAPGGFSGTSLTISNRLSCANGLTTDSNGLVDGCASAGGAGTFGTGNVLTIGDDRFVRTAGDTMTGALSVQATMSGYSLHVSTSMSGAGLADCNTNNTDRLQWDATNEVFSCDTSDIVLGTDTAGDFVGTITGGTGVDSTAATTGEDTDHTLSIDMTELTCGVGIDCSTATTFAWISTEIDATTWSDGANASNVWTFDVSGTDVTMTWASATVTLVGTLIADGLTLGQDENITLGAQTLDHDGTDFVFNDSISVVGILISADRINDFANQAGLANGDSTNVDSDSGLEVISNSLTLLRGCDDNQILKWDETNDDWNCEADDDSGGGGGTFGTGNVLTIGDDRWLRTSGGTMTGELIVQANYSGASLHVEDSLSSSGSLVIDGIITLGDGSATVEINSSDWDISTTGVITNAAMTSTQLTDGGTIGFEWVDAEVADNITIDLATLATTVTITDNESTAETNAIIFTAGGDLDGGNLGLESDGDLTYTPNTGNISATAFGGITEANLVDKTASESITGALWTFGNATAEGIEIGSTGVRITSDQDGAITFLGISAGNDEDLTWNFDDTADTVVVTSSTSVSKIDFGTITIVDDAGNIANDIIDSQHYAAGSIDLEHMSSQSVDSDNIVDATIVEGDIDADVAPIDGDFLQFDSTGNNFTWRNATETTSDLSLVIGTNTQAWDAELDTIAALTETNGNVMFVAGGAWTSDATPAIDCADCTGIVTAGIADGTILEADLDISNAGSDNDILTKNNAGSNFTWITTLPIANGGTNQTSAAVEGAIVYSTSSAMAFTAKGSSGQVLISQGTAAPVWGSGALRTGFGFFSIGLTGAGVTTGSGQSSPIPMPYNFIVTDVEMRVNLAPTGADLEVQVHVNNNTVSLFSTAPEIDAGALADDNNHVVDSSNEHLLEGDTLFLDINQVGSTLAGTGLTVLIKGFKYP